MSGKKITLNLFTIFSMFFVAVGLPAATGSVKINAPKDMAVVGTKEKVKVEYEVDPGAEGDHIHVTVDGQRVNLVRQMKSQTEVGPLEAGTHKICLEVNTKSHIPTGAQGCVSVTAK